MAGQRGRSGGTRRKKRRKAKLYKDQGGCFPCYILAAQKVTATESCNAGSGKKRL